jgi:hypothetical protein
MSEGVWGHVSEPYSLHRWDPETASKTRVTEMTTLRSREHPITNRHSRQVLSKDLYKEEGNWNDSTTSCRLCLLNVAIPTAETLQRTNNLDATSGTHLHSSPHALTDPSRSPSRLLCFAPHLLRRLRP